LTGRLSTADQGDLKVVAGLAYPEMAHRVRRVGTCFGEEDKACILAEGKAKTRVVASEHGMLADLQRAPT
jgi:hypothetical protein